MELWLFFDQLSVCGNTGASEVSSSAQQNLHCATMDSLGTTVSTHLRFIAFAANFQDALTVAKRVSLMRIINKYLTLKNFNEWLTKTHKRLTLWLIIK